MRGRHRAPPGARRDRQLVEPQDLPDTWGAPSGPHRWLRTELHARGVPRFRFGSPTVVGLLSLAGWPVGWLLHLCIYRDQYWVRVIESSVGWYSDGRVRFDRLYRSREEALAAARYLSSRIAEASGASRPGAT